MYLCVAHPRFLRKFIPKSLGLNFKSFSKLEFIYNIFNEFFLWLLFLFSEYFAFSKISANIFKIICQSAEVPKLILNLVLIQTFTFCIKMNALSSNSCLITRESIALGSGFFFTDGKFRETNYDLEPIINNIKLLSNGFS